MKQLSKHLTFANAISCIALFVALSGAAYAASTTLGKKSVKTQNLANGSVTALKLKGGSVTNLKLANGAVTGAKIAPGAVGSSQLANGAVRSEQLGGGVVTSGKLKNGAVGSEKLAGSAVGANQLAANVVSNGKIQDGAVSSTKLASSLLASLVRNVSYVSSTSPSNEGEETKTAVAECPAGKQVTGGGARVVGALTHVSVVESAPAVTTHPGQQTAWSSKAVVLTAPGEPWTVTAFAVCAEF